MSDKRGDERLSLCVGYRGDYWLAGKARSNERLREV